MALKDQLSLWVAAGLLDAPTAARIEAFEAGREPEHGGRISAAEVVAYVGAVVLLVGLGFLYGTQYASLGTVGRLFLIAVLVAGGLVAGELVQRLGGTAAARRARSAGWAVATLGVGAWFAQAFTDLNVLTRPVENAYPGSPTTDPSGSIMLGAVLGFAAGVLLLWRAGAALIAVATAGLAYAATGFFDGYVRSGPGDWGGALTWLVPAAVLIIISELLTTGPERRWAREVLRFAAVLPPVIAALVFSSTDTNLEIFAAFLALLGFAGAVLRSSGGYGIAGGVGLFIVVNEIGFRHFAESVGFPVVLLVSGVTLIAVAAAMFRLWPRWRTHRSAPAH